MVFPNLDIQGYVTNMTFSQAVIVSKLPIVATVWINNPIKTETLAQSLPKDDSRKKYRRGTSGKAWKKRALFPGSVSEQIPSPDHLKLISQDKSKAGTGAPLDNFRYDPSFREDVHLYIIDKGKCVHSQVASML
jgi:hypothetical protein